MVIGSQRTLNIHCNIRYRPLISENRGIFNERDSMSECIVPRYEVDIGRKDSLLSYIELIVDAS